MAENVLETKIQLRYGTYSQWMNSNVILMQGEAAICAFPNDRVIDGLSNTTPENTPPAIGIKIGDGRSYFYQLPWVQAIAADVYRWAKSENKPIYTANEISGLQSFIEENFHLSGDITIAPRIYQIIQGTNENENKYYLRYKENNEDGQWIIDTNHPIDLTNYAQIAEWIGDLTERYPTLGTFTATQTGRLIGNLNYTDNAQSNKFVTSVSEEGGIISVERAQPNFNNLAGNATVLQGGTGRTSLAENNVLVGNGTEQVNLIPIAETIAANNHLVPNYLIKAYVDNATAGLTGAMHFIGEATVAITPNSNIDPRIENYIFQQAQPGDVILSEAKEFVWTGGNWHLLGDESSYAIKGTIRDADISPEAEIQQSKIAGLDATFDTKVNKEEGKSLTSNDFTDQLKEKLDNIDENAQRNTIEHILLNGIEIRPTTIESLEKSVNIEIAEFDEDSQNKLANIEKEAQVNKIEHIVYDGVALTPDSNKTITIIPDPHNEHINKIESIYVNDIEWIPNKDKEVHIIIDQAALNLNVLEGAQIPAIVGTNKEEVEQISKKLQLARIAVSGDVKELKQTTDTYIILDCGDSTTVI